MDVLAVFLAALLQLLGCSVFFSQPMDKCSPAPSLASWLFLVATLCFLWDADVYPCRFRHMSPGWQLLVEIVAAIFLVEVSSIIIWCGLERFIFFLMELFLNIVGCHSCKPSPLIHWLSGRVTRSHLCSPSLFGYWLSGLVTSSASFAVLWYVLEATDGMCYLDEFTRNVSRNVRHAWRMMWCYFALDAAGRRRTLQVCQLAARRMRSCRRCDDDDDDDDDDECG